MGEIGSTYTGLSGKTKADFGHGAGRFVTYMNVFSNPITDMNAVEPIEIDSTQNCVQKGDVFFTTSSETPEEVGMSSVLLEKCANTYLNSFCFGYRPIAGIDSYYLAYMLRSEAVRRNIIFLAQGISRYNISKTKMMEIEVPIPDHDEQVQLGTFFYNLDNLITLHQRSIVWDYTTHSIGLVQKQSAWEQRKLGEIAEIIGGGTPSTSIPEYWDGDIHWYAPAEMEGKRYADNSIRKITELGLRNSSAKVLPADKTVLFTSRAGIGKTAILRHPAATNQGFQSLVLYDEYNPYFIYSRSEEIKQKAEGVASGSTFLEISGKMLSNIEIALPCKDEQDAIAAFFKRLDDLITLHQREYKIKPKGDKYANYNTRDKPISRILRSMDRCI